MAITKTIDRITDKRLECEDIEKSPLLSDLSATESPVKSGNTFLSSSCSSSSGLLHDYSDATSPESEESKSIADTDKLSMAALSSLNRSQVGMLICLSSSSLLAGTCMLIYAPFFTHEADVRGLGTTASGSVFSSFALSQVLAFPVMGWLAPRIGVTRLYMIGLVLVGVTTVVFGILGYISQPVPFLAWSLVVRVAEAVGTSAAQTSARTIIINQFPEQVNLAISMEEGMVGAGLCLGPALGGALYAVGGYGLPFYALGALFLVTAAASLALMPTVKERPIEKSEKGAGGRSYREMLLMFLSFADIWLIIATIVMLSLNWTALDPTMEPYVNSTLGIQPAELSLFFLASFAGYTLSSPLWGRLSDKVDNTFLLLAGCLAPSALGVLLIPPSPILGLQPSRLLLGVGMTLREVFQIGAYLPLVPLMLRISTNRGLESNLRSQAMVSSVLGTTFSFGNVLGPFGGGLVIDTWGYPIFATWLGVITVILSVIMTVRGIVYHVTRL